MHAHLRACLGAALRAVTFSASEEADARETMRLIADGDEHGVLDFPAVHLERCGTLGVGTWAWYLLVINANWEDGTGAFAAELPSLLLPFPPVGEAAEVEVVELCAELFACVADSESEPDDEAGAERETTALFALANNLNGQGNPDLAYNFAAAALDTCPDAAARRRREIALFALTLAQAAGRAHQVGLCGAALASACVDLAEAGALTRLEAFNEFELAIERLRLTPAPLRAMGARTLMEAAARRDFLVPFVVPLFFLLEPAERPAALGDAVSFTEWPDRASTPRMDTDTRFVQTHLEIQSLEFEIENARLALTDTGEDVSASANPITMMIDHPAYRRVVPHSRSFLKELDFDRHLMVLSHEVTHVVCYLGTLGAAIACLRTAHYDNEITMWSNAVPPDATREQMSDLLSSGPVELEPGDAVSLLRTEIGVELALKIRILQDVWEPWFEGMAVFGETSADPSLDASRINLVTEALRGLVDFIPKESDLDAMHSQFGAFSAEFESRCSAAIKRRGPARLDAYLRGVDDPYFAGYMVVRAVVSAWRATFVRPLQATTAFDLLLHATRFSLHEAIPDLALQSDEFEREAIRRMGDWVRSIARLEADAIAEFDRPFEAAEEGWSYIWQGGKLVRTPSSKAPDSTAGERQAEFLLRWLNEAFDSLSRKDDASRLPESGDSRLLASLSADVVRDHRASDEWTAGLGRYVERAQELINAAGFLPIGRADPAFFLERDGADRQPYLAVQIRTTEKHVETLKASSNLLLQPMPAESAAEIRAHYAKAAEPRLRINRVIDLAGLLMYRQPLHLLTFSYGDWFHLAGTTQLVNVLLTKQPDQREYLQRLLKRRLRPSRLERAINEELYAPDASLQRNRRWLQASRSVAWRMQDEAVDVSAWLDLLERKTEQALDPAAWRERRDRASRCMVESAFAEDPAFATRIAREGFEAMTSEFSHLRDALVGAFIGTGTRRPLTARELEALGESRTHQTGLFAELAHGWDVRPVYHEER